MDPDKLKEMLDRGQLDQATYNQMLDQNMATTMGPALASGADRSLLNGNEVGDMPPSPNEMPSINPPPVNIPFMPVNRDSAVLNPMNLQNEKRIEETRQPIIPPAPAPEPLPTEYVPQQSAPEKVMNGSGMSIVAPSGPDSSALDRAVMDQGEAIQSGVKNQEDFGQDLGRIYRDQAAETEILAAKKQIVDMDYQDRIEGEKKKLADLQNANIDPNNLWKTEDRGMAMLAVMFGGLGSSLLGTPNYALQHIQKKIDNDLQAQRVNLSKNVGLQKTALAETRKLYSDEQQALVAARVLMLDSVKAQIEESKAKFGSADAQAKADQVIAGLEADKERQLLNLNTQWEMDSAKIMAQQLRALGQQVNNATGAVGEINSKIMDKDQRKLAYKELAANASMDQAQKAVREIFDEYDKLSRAGMMVPGTEAYAKFAAKASNLNMTVRNTLKGQGQISDRDALAFEDMTAKKVDLMLNNQNVKRDELIDFLETRRQPTIILDGYGINRFGVQAPAQQSGQSSATTGNEKKKIANADGLVVPGTHGNQPNNFADSILAMASDPDAKTPVVSGGERASLNKRLAAVRPKLRETIESKTKEAAETYGVRPELMLGIFSTESSFNPYARSKTDARGLGQFVEGTWNEWAPKVHGKDVPFSKAYDPEMNIPVAAAYFKSLLDEFGDEKLALMAYNQGPENVRKAMKKQGRG